MRTLLVSLLLLPASIALSAPVKSVLGADGTGILGGEALPYEAEIEYLESTGKEYILLPDGQGIGIGLEIDFEIVKSGWNNPNFLTGLQSVSYYAGATPENETGQNFYAQSIFAYSQTNDKYARTTVIGIKSNISAMTGWALFARRQNNGTYAAGGCKRIFGASFVLGSVETILIPVRIGDEGFMYDRISGELLGNAGTGAFILGPDKE